MWFKHLSFDLQVFLSFDSWECLSDNILGDYSSLNVISYITGAPETIICLENTVTMQIYKSISISLFCKPFTNINCCQSWFNLTWILQHSQTVLEHFVFKKCTLNSFLGILPLQQVPVYSSDISWQLGIKINPTFLSASNVVPLTYVL